MLAIVCGFCSRIPLWSRYCAFRASNRRAEGGVQWSVTKGNLSIERGGAVRFRHRGQKTKGGTSLGPERPNVMAGAYQLWHTSRNISFCFIPVNFFPPEKGAWTFENITRIVVVRTTFQVYAVTSHTALSAAHNSPYSPRPSSKQDPRRDSRGYAPAGRPIARMNVGMGGGVQSARSDSRTSSAPDPNAERSPGGDIRLLRTEEEMEKLQLL